jgi:hypothetical protein
MHTLFAYFETQQHQFLFLFSHENKLNVFFVCNDFVGAKHDL